MCVWEEWGRMERGGEWSEKWGCDNVLSGVGLDEVIDQLADGY